MKRSEGSRTSLLDRLAHELTHLSNRSLHRWHRFTDRLADGRARMASSWVLFFHRAAAGRRRLADRSLDRWYRFSDRVAARRTRLADRISERDGIPFRWPILVGVALCALLAISAIVLIRAGRDTPVSDDASVDTPRNAVASIEDPMRRGLSPKNDDVPGYEVHLNEGGGYLFSYPDTWEIASAGDEARLFSPDDEVVMTFGTGPSGSLEVAADRVLENATSSYADVELVAGQIERTPQGFRSVVAGGDALDATGARVRFLVITIQAPDENRAITVRFSPSADPLEALPAIQEIISSFRVSQVQ
jgi:hypothetical protein